jgi:hypothetical protein
MHSFVQIVMVKQIVVIARCEVCRPITGFFMWQSYSYLD